VSAFRALRTPHAAALLGLGAALALQGCAARAPALDPRTARFPAPELHLPAIVEATLPGGAPVFLLEDHDVPLVRVFAAFRGGSLYDPPARAGLAEVASLAWRTGGAGERAPEAFDEALEDRAIELSLTLGREVGWASLSVLPADLEQGLELFADLLRRPAFREERVAWAASQVADRLRREADDPDSLAFRELRRALYRGHPRGVIPTPETAGRATRADLLALHRRMTGEGAWAYGVVGDFDPARLLPKLENLLGGLPGGGTGFPPIPAPPAPERRTVLVPKALAQATLVWGTLGPSRTDPGFYALDVADHVLGSGGFQSLLVREIRSNRGLAYSVGSFYQALSGFGVLGVRAATRPGAIGEVLGLLGAIPRGAAAGGLEAAEVARAQEALVNRHVFRYEDPADGVRERLGLLLDGLPADLPVRYPGAIQGVTAGQAAAALERFDLDEGVLVVVGPVDPESSRWRERGPVDVVSVP